MVVTLLAAALVLPTAQALETHDPIHVQGDADLAATADAEGWPGDGTVTDPYVIEGLFIEADGTDAIRIENTSAHLVIRDNVVRGSGPALWTGIGLANVTNLSVVANDLEDFRSGIAVRRSDGVRLQGNEADDHEAYGIVVSGSRDVDVIENRVALNRDGIRVWGNAYYGTFSRDVRIEDNHAEANDRCGIIVASRSAGSRIVDNHAPRNRHGICLRDTTAGRVVGNTAPGNDVMGVSLIDTTRTVVRDNVASGAVAYRINGGHNLSLTENRLSHVGGQPSTGISVAAASDSVVRDNRVRLAGTGIRVREGEGNLVRSNLVASTSDQGIIVHLAAGTLVDGNVVRTTEGSAIDVSGGQVTVTANRVDRSDHHGIVLRHSPGSIVRNNTVTWTETGIVVASSTGVLVGGNTVGIADRSGIDLWAADRAEIVANEVRDVDEALSLTDTDDTTATDNVLERSGTGIGLERSTGNLIFDNLVRDNQRGARLEESAGNRWYREPVREENVVGGPWTAGNFWSSYRGADADGDGLGDAPHPVAFDAFDLLGSDPVPPLDEHPLMVDRV